MPGDPVDLVVQLRPDVARHIAIGTGDAEAAARSVTDRVGRSGASLAAMHPDATDPEMRSWFVVGGLSPAQAEALAAELRDHAAVRAAYVQPKPSPA